MVSNVRHWEQIVRQQMPDSHFIIQKDLEALSEIIELSTMPAFATNITDRILNRSNGRVLVPITDEAATENFYCLCKKNDVNKYSLWFRSFEQKQ